MSDQPSPIQARSDLVRVLQERGYVHQGTNLAGLDARAAAGPVTAYIGFDATAPSLHVGNLVSIMLLRRLQQTGHRPIVLMGGGTTKVGDPSGKDATRQLLTEETIAANIASIRRAFGSFLHFEGEGAALMLNNADWLERFDYLGFLREFGPHFTINRMLTFDSVRLRLEREQPLSFLEFNYMLMQAVDFDHLYAAQGCILQMGGSDQWGNIVNGVELIRRRHQGEAFGLTTPLITTSSGVKMGKTAEGAVWLNPEMRSPYDYWQFWRNTEDADVGRFLRLFTDLPLDEVARLERLGGAEINAAKAVLANEATALLHGREAAAAAEGDARKVLTEGGVSAGLPTFELDWAGGEGWSRRHASALLKAAGLAPSLGQARQRIAQGVRINDELIREDRAYERSEALLEVGAFKVQVGKKACLVRPV